MGVEAVHCRSAVETDLPRLVELLLDDDIAQEREEGGEEEMSPERIESAYFASLQDILNDANNDLLVGEIDGEIVGMLQLTVIPGLSYRGSRRCLIEDMRVDRRYRRRGIGRTMVDSALAWAEVRGCVVAELFMHKDRKNAGKFYEALGFEARHRGYRLRIPSRAIHR